MRGHRRMPHEGRFFAGIEETQTKIVVRAIGREHECHLGVRKLARRGEQSGVALAVRVEHDGGRIARESCGRKCVYLENAQGCLRSLVREFCTHPRHRLHFVEPWGGPKRPEMWEIEFSIDLRTR